MEVLVSENESWKLHFERGIAYAGAGDTQRAAESFRQAITIAPDEPHPHCELGYMLFREGQYEAALEELRRTDELSPGFFAVQTEIYICERIIAGKLDAGALEVLRALEQLTDLGLAQSEDAVAMSRRAIKLAPACALGYFHLGKAVLETHPQIAEKSFQHCLNLRPDDTTAINVKIHQGLLLQANGDLEGACDIWQAVVWDYENNPHARMCEVLLSQHCAPPDEDGLEEEEEPE
jgi:tetratricopeptide (TPR) repeat protein